MTEDSWLMLWLKKWISAPDANLEYCRCLLVRWYTRSAFPVPKMCPGIFCTQKGLRTHIFYPVKTTGDRSSVCMQNYAHLKQLPLDKQQIGVSGARIFAHLRVGVPGTERSIGVPDFQVRVVSRTLNAIDLTASELLFQV